MIYLTQPYSHPNVEVRESRYQKAVEAVAQIHEIGLAVYSPIILGHSMVNNLCETSKDFKSWKEICFDALRSCELVYLLTLSDWEKSVGVKEELEYAKDHVELNFVTLFPELKVIPINTILERMNQCAS